MLFRGWRDVNKEFHPLRWHLKYTDYLPYTIVFEQIDEMFYLF